MTERTMERAEQTPETSPQPELSEDQLDDVAGGDIEITGFFPEHLA